jgi:hypothetical protein
MRASSSAAAAPPPASDARLVGIIAMLQRDKEELQQRLDARSLPPAASAAARARTAKELEACQQRLEETAASRAALAAEVQVRVGARACEAPRPPSHFAPLPQGAARNDWPQGPPLTTPHSPPPTQPPPLA